MITIDKASGLPIYLQIKHQLLYEIAVGRLTPGSALPSIRQLASSLGVTAATVRHAYAALEAEGLVVSYPGKGIIVAELSAELREQASQRQAALLDLFASTLERARALGYTPDEIRAALGQAFLATVDRPRVVFVGAEPEFVERYTPLLAEALRDLPVDVTGVQLRDLRERGPAWLQTAAPACVVTLVRSYADVRDLLHSTGLAVLGLALELAPETQRELLSLPRDVPALLVAERFNLTGMVHLIEQYWVPDGEFPHVALESRELAAAIQRAEVIIHTLRARRTVARLVPAGRRLIELRFVFNPISLARLRERIASAVPTDGRARLARIG